MVANVVVVTGVVMEEGGRESGDWECRSCVTPPTTPETVTGRDAGALRRRI